MHNRPTIKSPISSAVAAAIAAALGASMAAAPIRAEQPVPASGDANGPPQSSSQTDESPSPDSLSQVVVTATRRSENIQKIPLNIAAIDGAEITEKGLLGLTDLLRETPGIFSGNHGR